MSLVILIINSGGEMEKLIKMIEDVMVAITFAEAGEFDEANRIAGNEVPQDEKSATLVQAGK
jgi:hypothetical protein